MSTAASLPFDPEQLVARDPVVGRAAERAFFQAGRAVVPPLHLLGRDPWDSVPRVARLVGEAGDTLMERLYDLIFDQRASSGASMAFRFVPPGAGRRLGPLLDEHRGATTPWALIDAIGECAEPHDAPLLRGEARARDYDEHVLRAILVAFERMLLAQAAAGDAKLVFETFRELVGEVEQPVHFPLHPSWHVFRIHLGWLGPVMDGFDADPEARRRWSARAAAWLGLSHAKRAVDLLGRLAADATEPAEVRVAALEALAENGQEGALEAVARAGTVAAGGDEASIPAAVDAAAAQLAWQSTDAADLARDCLSRATETENHTAYANALYTLGRTGQPFDAEQITAALLHPEWTVRGAAGVALATLAGPSAVGRLREALAAASEPIERLELTTALARAEPDAHGSDLHEALCTRELVSAPWALINPIRNAIIEAFDAGGPEAEERRQAWGEVLNMGPLPLAPGAPEAPLATGAVPPVPVPVPVPEPAEPGRGTPNAQADAEATVDRLGRTPLVDILVGMLDDPDQGTPFTFGLFGGWGEGKSSVLRQLEARLDSEATTHKFWVAWFNAWQYERTDNLAAGLVQETVRGLVPPGRRERMGLAWRFAWRMHRARLIWAMTLLVVSAAATIYGFIAAAVDESIAKAILGAGALSVFSAIGTVIVKLYRHPVAAELWTYFRLPDYGEHLGLLPVMRDQVRELWKIRSRAGHGRPGRLVVVVDDLDRCSPTAIAATLDAVRLVMDMKGVVVIVALDERICLRAVADEYEGLTTPERSQSEIARDFLAKIVQLPIRLEPPDSLEEFLEYELFGVDRRNGPAQTARVERPTAANGGAEPPEDLRGESRRAEAVAHEVTRKAAGRYSVSDASAAAARLQREAMRDTADEREEFERVARASSMHNPRQLRRLRNTYRFIKTNSASLEWRKLMVMLFWQDCLHTLPAGTFAAYQARPTSGSAPPATVAKELVELTAGLFQDDAEFALYREAVLVAVLPRLDLAGAAP